MEYYLFCGRNRVKAMLFCIEYPMLHAQDIRDPAKVLHLLRGFAVFIALSKAQTIIQGNILVVWKNPLSGLHKAGCESIGSAEVGSRKRDLHREQTNRNR